MSNKSGSIAYACASFAMLTAHEEKYPRLICLYKSCEKYAGGLLMLLEVTHTEKIDGRLTCSFLMAYLSFVEMRENV